MCLKEYREDFVERIKIKARNGESENVALTPASDYLKVGVDDMGNMFLDTSGFYNKERIVVELAGITNLIATLQIYSDEARSRTRNFKNDILEEL